MATAPRVTQATRAARLKIPPTMLGPADLKCNDVVEIGELTPFRTLTGKLAIIKNIQLIDDRMYVLLTTEGSWTPYGEYVFNTQKGFKRVSSKVAEKVTAAHQKWRTAHWTTELTCATAISGSDPEIFVVDGAGKLIPAFVCMPRANVTESPYWDGFQAEFRVKAQACHAYLMDSVQRGLLNTLAQATQYDPKATLSTQSVFTVDPQVMQDAKAEHVALGCMPSKNAYELAGEAVPDGRVLPFRFAGGHMHYQITDKTEARIIAGVKTLDATIGLMSVALSEGYDNPIRRRFYGLPGEYRTPKHGVEYRTLSNSWLIHPMWAMLMFDMGRQGFSLGYQGFGGLLRTDEKEICEAIIATDPRWARKLLEKNRGIISTLLERAYPGEPARCRQWAWKAIEGGMRALLKHPEDIAKNWHLGRENLWEGHSEGLNCQWVHATKNLEVDGKV